MDNDRIETFWQSYLDTPPEDSPISDEEEYAAERWGDSPPLADELAGGTLAFFLAYAAEHRQRTGNGHAAGVRTVPGGVQVVYECRDTILQSDQLALDQRGFRRPSFV